MPRVLFVCSSDRTRAPLAAALFQALAAQEGLEECPCDSAGIRAQHGQHIAPEVEKVLAERGLLPRRLGVQLLTPKLIKSSELILCMTQNQEKELTTRFVSARNKTRTLMSILRTEKDIFDPNHLSLEKFRDCLQMMEPALQELVQRLL